MKLDILKELLAEEEVHVDSLPVGSEAGQRFAARRDALRSAIELVEAAVKYRSKYGPVQLLRSCGDSTVRIEFFEAVDAGGWR